MHYINNKYIKIVSLLLNLLFFNLSRPVSWLLSEHFQSNLLGLWLLKLKENFYFYFYWYTDIILIQHYLYQLQAPLPQACRWWSSNALKSLILRIHIRQIFSFTYIKSFCWIWISLNLKKNIIYHIRFVMLCKKEKYIFGLGLT